MGLRLITPPALEPLSLPEVKKHLRLEPDETHEDDYILALVSAARQHSEIRTNRAYITQAWELVLDEFPCGPLELPKPPLQEVVSITVDGTEVDPESYLVDTTPLYGRIVLKDGYSWPQVKAQVAGIVVRFICGYGGTVPEPLKQAMLLRIGHWFENREEVVIGKTATQVPMAAEALESIYRVVVIP